MSSVLENSFREEEMLSRLADLLRTQYAEIYQYILKGKETEFLKHIALHLDTSEEKLITMLISHEAQMIATQLKTSRDELERLKDMVDHMRCSP